MTNQFVVYCRGRNGSGVERKAARNYLVIPQERRVFLIMSQGMTEDRVLSICEEILRTENRWFAVYVLMERASRLYDEISAHFRFDDRIHPIIIGKATNFYVQAADVILTKAGILSDSFDEDLMPVGQCATVLAENVKSAVKKAAQLMKGSSGI